jgi:hypothetical protein
LSDQLYTRAKQVKKWQEKGLAPGPFFHDFRRSAVRNMTRAGISRNVAMSISGHKTESVFNRYDITDNRDLEDAARKLEKFRGGKKDSGQSSGQSQQNQPNLATLLIMLNLLKLFGAGGRNRTDTSPGDTGF